MRCVGRQARDAEGVSLTKTGAHPSFATIFGRDPDTFADATGRVDLFGEVTDRGGGLVLSMAIAQKARVELRRRNDRMVRAYSTDIDGGEPLAGYRLGEEAPSGLWIDYVQKLTEALRDEGFELPGFDVWVSSDVPLGCGLSSSTALVVSLLRALRQAFSLPIDDVEMARLDRRVEAAVAGYEVGIVAPMVSSLSSPRSALLLDTRTLSYDLLPLPKKIDVSILSVTLDDAPKTARVWASWDECERAALALGVDRLGELCANHLERLASLPEPVARRLRHVIAENERVLIAAEALRAGDLEKLGALLFEAHASLRDEALLCSAELDLLVELSRAQVEVLGARPLTAGPEGAVMLLSTGDQGPDVIAALVAAYAERTGRSLRVISSAAEPAFASAVVA